MRTFNPRHRHAHTVVCPACGDSATIDCRGPVEWDEDGRGFCAMDEGRTLHNGRWVILEPCPSCASLPTCDGCGGVGSCDCSPAEIAQMLEAA